MDQVIIEGLHTCKPHNAPTVGQIKSFLVTEETSQRTGNQWTKIRSAKPDEGGRHYRIISVRPTGREPDTRGNISFNLGIEEAQAPAQPPPPQHGNGAPGTPPARQFTPPAPASQPQAFDTVEQHLMRSANLYALCLGVASTVIRDAAQRKGLELSVEDQRQIATTLYLDAKHSGYVAHMSDKEQRPAAPKKDPY